MENLEIQREAIIEVVGTQYDNRMSNHMNLDINQRLFLQRDCNNAYDKNAILVITDTGKELGYIPKGYATIYAPAIDSKKYNFIIEIVKAEPDEQRPILIIKITSENKNLNEKEIENSISDLVLGITHGYEHQKNEYLQFINSKSVNIDSLISCLDFLRLTHKIYELSLEHIRTYKLNTTSQNRIQFTKETIIESIEGIKTDINGILKKYQKMYNDLLDIEDEDEYQRIQSEIREKRKKFRTLNDFIETFADEIKNFKSIYEISSPLIESPKKVVKSTDIPNNLDDTIFKTKTSDSNNIPEKKFIEQPQTLSTIDLSETAFIEWLKKNAGVLETTAKTYISSIHSVEKLYQTVFGVRKNIIDAESKEVAKDIIDTVVEKEEYIDANKRRNNGFDAALARFSEFAEISTAILERRNLNDRNKTHSYVLNQQTPLSLVSLDFDNIDNGTYYKPVSFTFNGLEHKVGSWSELYTRLLRMLFFNDFSQKILLRYVGKSLYGDSIDFVEISSKRRLHKPIAITSSIYAEGDLSTIEIIKHIKFLKDICGIDNNGLQVNLFIDKSPEIDFRKENYEQLTIPTNAAENIEIPTINNQIAFNTSDSIIKNNDITTAITINPNSPSTFVADLSKPFALKDAIISLLSSNDSAISKFKTYKDGMTSKSLMDLIKNYYNKSVSIFDISKILMTDPSFISLGKGCYTVNGTLISEKKSKDDFSYSSVDKITSETSSKEVDSHRYISENVDKIADLSNNTEMSTSSLLSVRNNDDNNVPQSLDFSQTIINLIKKNSDKIQFEDGFGSYDVKILLSQEGINNITEAEIENIMSQSNELEEFEEGYYIYKDFCGENISETALDVPIDFPLSQEELKPEIITSTRPITTNNNVTININGNQAFAFNYSDALCKICEYAINYKPFRMATVSLSGITLNNKTVFYRQSVPIDGYILLSNGLQVISINNYSELLELVDKILSYCQIDNNKINFIN